MPSAGCATPSPQQYRLFGGPVTTLAQSAPQVWQLSPGSQIPSPQLLAHSGAAAQSESAQSIAASQSASRPSIQLPSAAGGAPQSAGHEHEVSPPLQLLSPQAGAAWVLDLSALAYVGSSVLGLMVNVRQRVKQAGGQLVLCGLSDQLLQIFHTCSLERLFVISRSMQEAVERVR